MKISKNLIKSGVYGIFNTVSLKWYVGSSLTVYRRLLKHRADLRRTKHGNPYLQNSWLKHGEDSFRCFLLEECPEENLISNEQKWIDILPTYNIIKDVVRWKISECSKKKMSITRRAKIASGEISKTHTKPISKFTLDGIFVESYSSISEAARSNNISADQIRRVLSGKHKRAKEFMWAIVSTEFLDPYKKRCYKQSSGKLKKKVVVLDTLTSEIFQFNCLKTAAKFFGKTHQTISRASKNKRNLYKNRYKIDLLKSDEFRETPEVGNPEPSTNLNGL